MKLVDSGQDPGFTYAFNIAFSMAMVSSFYVLFQTKERVSKSKHQQFVSGVNAFSFWLSSYLWDMVTYVITIVGIIITFICFQEDGFKTFEELGTNY